MFSLFHHEGPVLPLCYGNRAHADTHGAEGGVRTPVGTTHPLVNPLSIKLHRGVNFKPTPQLPQSPFWKDAGIFTRNSQGKHHRKIKHESSANPGDHRPVAMSPGALPGEAPRPPSWAGLFGTPRMGKAEGRP